MTENSSRSTTLGSISAPMAIGKVRAVVRPSKTVLSKPWNKSNLHYFFFFPFAHFFHLLDFIVGEFLDFIHGTLFIVFCNFLVFHRLFVGVVVITPYVAHGGAVFLEHFV